jgi:HSP20 family protein
MGSMIRLDVSETDQAYTVKAEIPGCRKEDIDISLDGNVVTIHAETKGEKEEKQEGKIVRSERYRGEQYRSFTLPQEVDDQKAQAKYQDGILELTLPKKSGASRKQISIQ